MALNESYGKLPLSFEPNQGQTDKRVKFLSHGHGYSLFLTPTEAVLALRKSAPDAAARGLRGGLRHVGLRTSRKRAGQSKVAVLRVSLEGANRDPQISGLDQLPGKANYFVGRDSREWRTNVPTYAGVRYRGVYPGVDLIYRSSEQRRLEYDFVVSPGADPKAIGLGFAGQEGLKLDPHGDLIVHTAGGDVVERAPVVYQQIDGRRWTLDAKFVLTGKHRVGFRVAAYDRSQPLVIDPALVYSTYLGGSGEDFGYGIAIDGSGNAYVTGQTQSTNFPTTAGAFQTTLGGAGATNAFIAKLNADGSALVYSTYLGGNYFDEGSAIAVDGSGNAYVTGWADSANFPTTPGAFQTTFPGYTQFFAAKLNASGSTLIYSTFLGAASGSLAGGGDGGIAVDGSGNAYIAGGGSVTKLNADGSALVYSYSGPYGADIRGIAIDGSGNAYVTGSGFPTTAGAFQTTCAGICAFVAKLNASGSLVYSTYLSGSGYVNGHAIAVDGSGNAYVTGGACSTNFPTTTGAFQTTYGGSSLPAGGGCSNEAGDAFVTELNADGSGLVYSTYLGGSAQDSGDGIAVDGSGNAYVTGWTESLGADDFPTTPGAFQTTFGGGESAFVAKLNASGSALVYSTYLGGGDRGNGIAVDGGNAYVAGWTGSGFPTTAGAFQTTLAGTWNAFVTKLSLVAGPPAMPTPSPTPTPAPAPPPGGPPISIGPIGGLFPTPAPGAAIAVMPEALTFNPHPVGAVSAAQNVTVTNSGLVSAHVASVAIDSDSFAETDNCVGTLVPHASCNVQVVFAPTAKGSATGTLQLVDDSQQNQATHPQAAALTGTGTAGSGLTAAPAAISFAVQMPGTTSPSRQVRVTNNLSSVAHITNVAISGSFSASNNCSGPLECGPELYDRRYVRAEYQRRPQRSLDDRQRLDARADFGRAQRRGSDSGDADAAAYFGAQAYFDAADHFDSGCDLASRSHAKRRTDAAADRHTEADRDAHPGARHADSDARSGARGVGGHAASCGHGQRGRGAIGSDGQEQARRPVESEEQEAGCDDRDPKRDRKRRFRGTGGSVCRAAGAGAQVRGVGGVCTEQFGAEVGNADDHLEREQRRADGIARRQGEGEQVGG